MSDTPKEKKKKSNAEKPVSLFGAKFEKVLGALLKTPRPKKKQKEENKSNDRQH